MMEMSQLCQINLKVKAETYKLMYVPEVHLMRENESSLQSY
jgi:hypothetical protein